MTFRHGIDVIPTRKRHYDVRVLDGEPAGQLSATAARGIHGRDWTVDGRDGNPPTDRGCPTRQDHSPTVHTVHGESMTEGRLTVESLHWLRRTKLWFCACNARDPSQRVCPDERPLVTDPSHTPCHCPPHPRTMGPGRKHRSMRTPSFRRPVVSSDRRYLLKCASPFDTTSTNATSST